MNDTDFYVYKANKAQREYVLERVPIQDKQKRENAIIYVAVDKTANIIGRIVIQEKDVPAPIMGKYWFLFNLFVHPDFRRKGIATKLVNEIKRQAEFFNIVYLYGSANATLEASMFYLKQNFTLHAYGKPQDDKTKPLWYGNYSHWFSYCIRRKPLSDKNGSVPIRAISKDEIPYLIEKYEPNEKRKEYFLSRTDNIFGFAAIGKEEEIKGVLLAMPDSMQAPLDSIRWWVFLFVEPKYRNHGIGQSLIFQLYQYAQGKNVIQLSNFDSTENNIGFWYKIGFDIFFWDINPRTGKRPTTAMLRVSHDHQ